jgi:hypothetical protein
MPISRLFNAHDDAEQAVAELKRAGFARVGIHVFVHPASVDAMVIQDIPRPRAIAYAEQVARGETLVVVNAPMGTGTQVTKILERHRPDASDVGQVTYETPFQDPAAPLSSLLTWPVLLHDPTPLSSLLKWDTLSPRQTPKDRSFGMPMLIDNPTPLSARLDMKVLSPVAAPLSARFGFKVLSPEPAPFSAKLGWRLLLAKAAPLSSRLGMKTLSHGPAPFSAFFMMKVLSNNPTPFSSWLGWRVLEKDKPTAP